jgi:hypothetical protein
VESWKDLNVMLRETLLYRQKHEKLWCRWWNVYRYGDVNGPSRDPESVRVYIARQIVQVLIPSLYFKNPYVITSPIVTDDPKAEEAAMCMEAWINYYVNTIPRVKEAYRAAALDAIVTQKGYVECVWQKITDEIPVKNAGERLTYFRQLMDAPSLSRVSRYDLLIDPYAPGGLDTARWMARGYWVPIEAVRDNKVFKENVRNKFDNPERRATERETLAHIVDLEQLRQIKNKAFSSAQAAEMIGNYEPVGMVQIWRVIDRKYNRMVQMSLTVDGFLEDRDNPYSHLPAFPMSELEFANDNDMDHPNSLLEYLIDQSRETNFIATRQHDAMKRFSRVILMDESRFADPAEAERNLKEAKDGTVLKARAGQGNAVAEVPWNDYKPEWWALRDSCRVAALDTAGIPPTFLGTGHSKFKTASEVRQISQSYDIRLDDLKEQVASWVEHSMTLLGRNINVFLTDTKKFSISGQPIDVGPEEISGEEFTYTVQLSEGSPENEGKRLERLMMLYKLAQTDPLISREQVIVPLVRAIGERNPRRYLANQDPNALGGMPSNMPAMGAGGATPRAMGEGAEAMAQPGMEPGVAGGMNEQQQMLAALQAMGGIPNG